MDLKREWRIFLASIGKTESDVAKENGYNIPNLNRRINSQTIKYVELSDIVEKYGYSIKIHLKKED